MIPTPIFCLIIGFFIVELSIFLKYKMNRDSRLPVLQELIFCGDFDVDFHNWLNAVYRLRNKVKATADNPVSTRFKKIL